MPIAAIKQELARFKGVGPKTVACVLMFCLQRAEFPVDTHVWRISRQMGWVPRSADRNATYAHLNARVPDAVKFELHVLLIAHGKACYQCAANGRPQRPADAPCPLKPLKAAKSVEAALAAAMPPLHAGGTGQGDLLDLKRAPQAAADAGSALKAEAGARAAGETGGAKTEARRSADAAAPEPPPAKRARQRRGIARA